MRGCLARGALSSRCRLLSANPILGGKRSIQCRHGVYRTHCLHHPIRWRCRAARAAGARPRLALHRFLSIGTRACRGRARLLPRRGKLLAPGPAAGHYMILVFWHTGLLSSYAHRETSRMAPGASPHDTAYGRFQKHMSSIISHEAGSVSPVRTRLRLLNFQHWGASRTANLPSQLTMASRRVPWMGISRGRLDALRDDGTRDGY